MGDTQLSRLLQEGIAAARAGQKEQARELLLQVIALDAEVEPAWLWLSGVVDDPEERQICLENVLALNPDNTIAQKGLVWLREQDLSSPTGRPQSADANRSQTPQLDLSPGSSEPGHSTKPGGRALEPRPMSSPPPVPVEIDPYGCPYCGGSVSGEEPRCDHCRRPVVVRYRKREERTGVGWLVLCFLLLAIAAWLEGHLVSQLVQIGQLPQWLSHTALNLMVGAALFSPEGLGRLVDFAGTVTLVNHALAGLCLLAAAGLALRSRVAYFGSFLLACLMVSVTGAELLTQLTGWLPALFRLALIVVGVIWLVDSAPAFEWETRTYNSDIDQDLRNDLDYHNRGQHYYDIGMWAKAAAHWRVATRLAPTEVQYRAELANAYLRMGYPEAALAEAGRAVVGAPEDRELRAFRDSLAPREETH